MADESAAPLQRRNLALTLEVRLPGFSEVDYRDWGSLLSRLAHEARQRRWRGPLVLDELPYLVGASPELPAALQRFLDHDARAAGLVVALAGSSQRMMQGLTLDASAPLYGRASELLRLRALPAGCIGGALGLRDAQRCVQAWALWGGVPRYWELAAAFRDQRQAVEALALDPLGPLHDEPARLLLEESPPAVALRPMLDAIGAGAHRVSEIAGRIGQPATSLTRPLARLQELELVVRETPFGEPERSSKRALYRLADPFLRLWFSFIAPRRSLLMQVPRATRLSLLDGALPHLCAATWEELCRQAVPRLAGLGGHTWGTASRSWSAGGPEWHVVAEGVERRALLLGEVKWVEGEPSVRALEEAIGSLLARGVPSVRQAEGASVHHVVFMSRLPRRAPARLAERVQLVDAKEVLAALG